MMKITSLKRAGICLILVCSLLLCTLPTVSAYSGVSGWAEADISMMRSKGLLPDCLKNADLSKNITRLEMCKVAVLAFSKITGIDDPAAFSSGTSHFSDTSDRDVIIAYDLGIVSGYTDGTFRPNNTLTRQEFFTIVYNLLTNACYWDPSTVLPGDLTQFSDVNAMGNFAMVPAEYMISIGVVAGNNTGKLNPLDTASREQALCMFYRAYDFITLWNNEKQQAELNDGIIPEPAPAWENGFSNISIWAISSVQEMDQLDLIPSTLVSGDMTLDISRQQICETAVLAYNRIMRLQTEQAQINAAEQAAAGEDVEPIADYVDYVPKSLDHFTDTDDFYANAAFELNLVSGYSDGRFGISDSLTREQLFTIAMNFLTVTGYTRSDTRAVVLSSYTDGRQTADWAQSATRILIYIGAVSGTGTGRNKTLSPKATISREQCMIIFLKCFNFINGWLDTHNADEPNDDPDALIDLEQQQLLEDIVAFTLSFKGYPYVYGGAGPSVFDCSGLMYYVYRHFGYDIPRTATAQMYWSKGLTIPNKEDLQPGDLVLFGYNGPASTSAYHVGMYIGNHQFIHAANSSRGVVIDNLWTNTYYVNNYICGLRVVY